MATTTVYIPGTAPAWVNTGVVLLPGYGVAAGVTGTYTWSPSGEGGNG